MEKLQVHFVCNNKQYFLVEFKKLSLKYELEKYKLKRKKYTENNEIYIFK